METKTNLESIQELIPSLSLEDLRTLNHQVYGMIGVEKRRQGAIKRFEFKTGDRVTFKARHGIVKTGTIVKCKRTKAFVDCGEFRNWDVPFAMLEKAE